MAATEQVKLPPLLAMSLVKKCPRSEYGHSFTPKVKMIPVSNVKLAPSFLYRRPPDYVRGQPRANIQAGFVPAVRYGGSKDYVFLNNNSCYSNTRVKRSYFIIRPDWVSENEVKKNNPFS